MFILSLAKQLSQGKQTYAVISFGHNFCLVLCHFPCLSLDIFGKRRKVFYYLFFLLRFKSSICFSSHYQILFFLVKQKVHRLVIIVYGLKTLVSLGIRIGKRSMQTEVGYGSKHRSVHNGLRSQNRRCFSWDSHSSLGRQPTLIVINFQSSYQAPYPGVKLLTSRIKAIAMGENSSLSSCGFVRIFHPDMPQRVSVPLIP